MKWGLNMNEVTFPGVLTATAAAAIVSLNAGSYPGGSYPKETKAFVVEQPSPTAGQLTDLAIEPTAETFANEIAAVYASLSEEQEPLGKDFEDVWDANVDKLYEF